jgi:hypothetical protein
MRPLLLPAAASSGVVAVIVGVRLVLGVWPAAVVLAALAVAGLLMAWASVEARAFGGARRSVVVHGRAAGADHVAFARALAVVVEAYLAECEREGRR